MPRKKPFSAKQKKEQLKAKRERKRQNWQKDEDDAQEERKSGQNTEEDDDDGEGSHLVDVSKINQQPKHKAEKGYDPNRYRLHFMQDSKEEILKRKEASCLPYVTLPETALEVDVDDIYQPGTVLDLPQRPPWDYKYTKSQLEAKEEHYFKGYLDDIISKYTSDELSYFELNLETWRQLWRVLEMSDIILLITDIRHPALHFSPAMFDYVTRDLQKPLVLVLNKIDLAAPSLVVAWKNYFTTRFPGIHIVCFTSFPKDTQDVEQMHADPGKTLHKRRRRGNFTAVGPKQLYKVCESIVDGKVDLSSWKEKIEADLDQLEAAGGPEISVESGDGSYSQHVQYKDNTLTIGCCGYPNVGKSSLMNGLVGRKVVSTSRTPGHTKHFQTIYLTRDVKLCDSPGLVFPSLVPKPMQILAGIYPIAQVREPYTAVGYLSQRLHLPRLLQLKHPEADGPPEDQDLKWSAYDVCDAWAEKRGFVTARAARHDVYRAANSILRSAVDGRICLCMRPPRYTQQIERWNSDPETQEIGAIQAMHRQVTHFSDSEGEHQGSESDEDEKDIDLTARRHLLAKDTMTMSNPFSLLSHE